MTLLKADTLWELVEARATETPERTFVVDEFDRSLTFGEYRDAALRTAAGLHHLGVDAHTTVAWQLPTWIESLVLMGALSRVGARQLALLPIYRHSEVSHLLSRSGAELWFLPSLWRGTDYYALAENVRTTVPGVRPVYCDFDLPAADSAHRPPHDPRLGGRVVDGVSEAEPGRWLFPTSGTTSAPKIAVHTDRSIMAGAAAFCVAQGVTPDDRYGIAFPITHIGGASNLAAALMCGFSLALTERFDPARTSEVFRSHRVTIAGGGPAFYAAYLARQRLEPGSSILPDLRFMTGGGAPMPPAMHLQVRDEIGGAGCAHGYGMTEACIVAMNHPGDHERRLTETVGRPTRYVEVQVVGEDGTAVVGEGEIRIRGEALFQGYLGDATVGWDDEGWFRTGDLGRLDAEGYLHVTGRMKDIVIRKGENVSAAEVEEVLRTHPAVDDVAVVGLPDDERGELVCAVVQPAAGTAPTLTDLAEHCVSAGLMRQKVPEQLELLEQLPRNPAGKVLKPELRERLGRVDA